MGCESCDLVIYIVCCLLTECPLILSGYFWFVVSCNLMNVSLQCFVCCTVSTDRNLATSTGLARTALSAAETETTTTEAAADYTAKGSSIYLFSSFSLSLQFSVCCRTICMLSARSIGLTKLSLFLDFLSVFWQSGKKTFHCNVLSCYALQAICVSIQLHWFFLDLDGYLAVRWVGGVLKGCLKKVLRNDDRSV